MLIGMQNLSIVQLYNELGICFTCLLGRRAFLSMFWLGFMSQNLSVLQWPIFFMRHGVKALFCSAYFDFIQTNKFS